MAFAKSTHSGHELPGWIGDTGKRKVHTGRRYQIAGYLLAVLVLGTMPMVMLAQAMQFNPDPTTQRTAGQLRTVARWRQLPQIIDARPEAIPATPAGYPPDAPVIPTPVRNGVPAPEIQLQPTPH